MAFYPWEIAEIHVNGRTFRDWESVMVHREFAGSLPHTATFTATEISPAANDVRSLQIKPGDYCDVTLAGQRALYGKVAVRQVSFDKENHGVQIQVRSLSMKAVDSVPVPETIHGGQWEDANLLTMGNDVLTGLGIKLIEGPGGGAASEIFKGVTSINMGETAFQFITRLAAHRNLHVGEDLDGQMYVAGEPADNDFALIEGQNIRSARITIQDIENRTPLVGLGQDRGTDQERYQKVSERRAQDEDPLAHGYRPYVWTAEMPVSQRDLQYRVDWEKSVRQFATVIAEITVSGWLTKINRGGLWVEGIWVPVYTQMGMLNQRLFVQSITYTQDSENGTQTQLTCQNFSGREPDLSAGADPTGQGHVQENPQSQSVAPTDPNGVQPNPAHNAPGALPVTKG